MTSNAHYCRRNDQLGLEKYLKQDKLYQFPLYYATFRNRLHVVQLLVEKLKVILINWENPHNQIITMMES